MEYKLKDREMNMEKFPDEEPKLINQTHMNRTLYLESAAAMGKRWKGRIFSVLAAICAVYSLFIGNWLLFFLALLIAALALFSHLILAYRDFSRLKRRHGGEEWGKTIRFFSDCLESASDDTPPAVYPYRNIRNEYETEHMYVLDFGSGAPAITMAKDGFTVGTFQEMKEWLLERQRASYNEEPVEEEN